MTLELADDAASREQWDDNRFVLSMTVEALPTGFRQSLAISNRGERAFNCTTLLHTYFATPDVTQCGVKGLQGLEYTDKARGFSTHTEDRQVVVVPSVYTDRVYKNAPDQLELSGVVGSSGDSTRTLSVVKEGFRDTVVWNPWVEKAKEIGDLGDDEYPSFVCVEVGSVATPFSVDAGATWTGAQTVTVLPAPQA